MNKALLILPALTLTGCWATKWIVDNEETIAGAANQAEGMGPYGAIAGLGLTTVLGISKWWEHKQTGKDLIKSVEKAKQDLPEASRKILHDGLQKNMPSKVRKLVSKVRKKL